MSVVTEFKITIRLRIDTPREVLDLIANGIQNKFPAILDHDFFKKDRWMQVFIRMGYMDYTEPYLVETPTKIQLHLHADINYEDAEIDSFLEWITPYALGHKKKRYVGWKKPEWADKPINLYIIK